MKRLPCPARDGGKRSAVAGVNDSPVDCQSRDGTARRRLSALLTEGAFFTPSDPAMPGHLKVNCPEGAREATLGGPHLANAKQGRLGLL